MTKTKKTMQAIHALRVPASTLRILAGTNYDQFLTEVEAAAYLFDTPEKREFLSVPLERAQGPDVRAALVAAGYPVTEEADAFLNALYRVRWLVKVKTDFSITWDFHDREKEGTDNDSVDGGFFCLEPEVAYTKTPALCKAESKGLRVVPTPYVSETDSGDDYACLVNVVQWDSLQTMVPYASAAFEEVGGLAGLSDATVSQENKYALLHVLASSGAASYDDVAQMIESVFGTDPLPFSEAQIRAIWSLQATVLRQTGLIMSLYIEKDSPLDSGVHAYHFRVEHEDAYQPSQALLDAAKVGMDYHIVSYVRKK